MAGKAGRNCVISTCLVEKVPETSHRLRKFSRFQNVIRIVVVKVEPDL